MTGEEEGQAIKGHLYPLPDVGLLSRRPFLSLGKIKKYIYIRALTAASHQCV
jgi:hypothetical protein